MWSAHRPGTPVEDPLQTTVEVEPEFLVGRIGSRGERPDDQPAPGRELAETFAAQLTQPAYDAVAPHRATDGSADHEADQGGLVGTAAVGRHEVDDQRGCTRTPSTARDVAQLDTAAEAMRRRKHGG